MGMDANTELHGSGVRESEPLTRSGLGRSDAVETTMPKPAKKEAEQNLVAEAASRALSDASGDVIKASKMLETAVRQSQPLRDLLTDPLIAAACYDAVRQQCIKDRREIWRPAAEKRVPGKVTGAMRVVKLAEASLLMFPLPGGLPLGRATREQVTAAADFYRSQSNDMGVKASWLQLIGQSLPDGKTVSDVLSDKRLRELQAEAKRHAA